MYKKLFLTLAGAAALLLGAACTDITTEPKVGEAGGTAFDRPEAYREFLAKLYAGLAVSGQQGPAGMGDIALIDEGFSQYVRGWWQLQTIPTDEAVIGWGDESLPELNTMAWGSANRFIQAFYYRIFFQIALANEFLRETSDAALATRDVSAQLRADIEQYRAEARFLRALSYWHGIDLFGNIPLVRETDNLGVRPPDQSTRAEIFSFIVEELNAIRSTLPAVGAAQYGRADQGALLMLLAKVHMNAEAYGLGAQYAQARMALEQVIGSGAYQLAPEYMRNFLADNHTSQSIIFPIPSDGMRTRSYGGTTYLVQAAIGGTMPRDDYGVGGNCCWGGLRTTQQMVALFGGEGGPDVRNSFYYTTGHTEEVTALGTFTSGYAAPKYRNVTSTGEPGSNLEFPDTDFPMYRLADAYLMYAEVVLRDGGGDPALALQYVNWLRERAYGNTNGNITAEELTLELVLAERARELFWEGHRRTDLIRYGLFTGSEYLWAFKGGAVAGQAVSDHLKLYPIPASEMLANPNLTQNPGY
jgi:starch-binding outer membrane protein, SusD/RagB family